MWPNPQETADLFIFSEEILNGKLYFVCSESFSLSFAFVVAGVFQYILSLMLDVDEDGVFDPSLSTSNISETSIVGPTSFLLWVVDVVKKNLFSLPVDIGKARKPRNKVIETRWPEIKTV